MQNLYTHKDSNIRKTWLLFTVFFVVVILLGYFFNVYFNNPAILTYAIIFSVGMSFVSYWFSDKLVLAMAHAQPVSREHAREIYNIVENLSIAAGLPMPKIYLIKDPAPNAFATGRSPKNAVVAVTTGLLDALDRSEIEGVIAHELSHIGNWDMLLSTVVVILVGFISMAADLFLRSLWFGGSRDDENRHAGAIVMVLTVAGAILLPVAATLIQLAISRKREFLADASGALLTRYPEGLASALEKISQYPRNIRSASNTTAHLWFEDPFGADAKRKKTPWFHKLFMTHPPVEERITALRGVKI